MDISALLPGNMGSETSSLNDDFSGQTPAGDNIFSKAIGAKTYFRTEGGGLVLASFVFDPWKSFGSDHHMASCTSDWIADLRNAITKHLVDEKDIAPKIKSLEESVWDQLTTLLPKSAVAKNLFADNADFTVYSELLKTSVTRTFSEERALTKALSTQQYSFSYEIAIDAYPSPSGTNSEKKQNASKTGVLTFHLQGLPDGKVPEEPKEELADAKKGRDKGGDTSSRKRKHADTDKNAAKSADKDKSGKKPKPSEADAVLKEMNMAESFKNAHVDSVKEFPHTASTFFDMVGRWFSSVVSRRAVKLEKSRNRNPLYH